MLGFDSGAPEPPPALLAQLLRLWIRLALALLRLLAPWRFFWARSDLHALRPFCPELDTNPPPLPLPICLGRRPTRMPAALVPVAHLCLAVVDAVLMGPTLLDAQSNRCRYRRRWAFPWPSLTQGKKELLPVAGWRRAATLTGGLIWEEMENAGRRWRLVSYAHAVALAYIYLALQATCAVAAALAILRRTPVLWLLLALAAAAAILHIGRLPALAAKLVSRLSAWRRPPRDGATIRAYHGTSRGNAAAIRKEGFKPSRDGMLGRGVYVTRDVNKTLAYGGPDRVILELRVRVGKVRVITHQHHLSQKTWASEGCDAAWVPAGCGMVHSGCEEGCVASADDVMVVRAWRKELLVVLVLYDLLRRALDLLTSPVVRVRPARAAAASPAAATAPAAAAAPSAAPPRAVPAAPAASPGGWNLRAQARAGTCLQLPVDELQSWCHKTVPPALVHKVKVRP